MRYIVVHVTTEPIDPDGSFEGSIDEDEQYQPLVKAVVLCKDKEGVGRAIKSAEKLQDGTDWAVFEVKGNKTDRCAVVFEKDGKTVVSIQ